MLIDNWPRPGVHTVPHPTGSNIIPLSATPFKIDGVTVPTPTEYDFGIEDLSSEETGRTLDGIMHKDVVATKDYYTCVWNKLSWEDAASLLQLVEGKTQVEVTYANPLYPNQMKTDIFYVGKRTGKANNLKDKKNTWKKITFQFIRI